MKSSHLGLLIDPKSDSSVSKVVQQLGFVGLQLYREGKFYSSQLVKDCFSNFVNRHPPIGRRNRHPSMYIKMNKNGRRLCRRLCRRHRVPSTSPHMLCRRPPVSRRWPSGKNVCADGRFCADGLVDGWSWFAPVPTAPINSRRHR